MDNYLPHSTLADMNATHLDIERIRIAAHTRAVDMLATAVSLSLIVINGNGKLNKVEQDTINYAAKILRQMAEGK